MIMAAIVCIVVLTTIAVTVGTQAGTGFAGAHAAARHHSDPSLAQTQVSGSR